MYLLIFLRDLLQYKMLVSSAKWCIRECVTDHLYRQETTEDLKLSPVGHHRLFHIFF